MARCKKMVSIPLQTAKDIRVCLKHWICKNKEKKECGQYSTAFPELHCKYCFVKKLDMDLKDAIKEEENNRKSQEGK